MKKRTPQYLIVVVFWIAIACLIRFGYNGSDSFYLKLLNFGVFTLGSILVTLPFSNKLFIPTLSHHKTVSFLVKFVLMSLFLTIFYTLISELFHYLNIEGFFTMKEFDSGQNHILSKMLAGLPGTMSASFMLCAILLYYEYSDLQKNHLESQLQILHAQINPHFMFNVLNYIYVLMQKDVELASELLLKYSDTLRYQLYSGQKEYVKLEQEVQFLKNFIDVEKFRWEDKLDVSCNWQIESGNINIPPLLFIPFIENAFKHVARSKEEKGYIHILLEQKKKVISLKVENSVSSPSVKKEKESGIGLKNVKKRLKILYGERYLLNTKETDNVYFSQLTIFI
ncbi:two-component system LytT family sensor kinase [Parabacteroides sp. PF5-5]|uniref:sensor histidine kinase n=1 Tax=unclassified Parabacteroides TaxID=2649774 RepID=UPI002475AA34|nr:MULTISPECIES: histidine kinase [unclassified Parabacteroides]MDH6303970.1 two-component system LytT family sensor kinase [Parabacteroides sp. PH5-39]MDH6314586.1 two-component system LytT family sensor kinase [Parabacteroides sp. PF5-13]MDH6318349.1 two-component system LytT family sensor kinase [Parabacteroides sp. PH5-13]MDH6322359.1 two-component system LytT family sensor kinase [Parabacteroides sp. PH5-8]MDH6325562.1 two-component system LytT family sensor kinase [Parabacteroides sp. PH